MTERHGKILTNVDISNNQANDILLDTKGYSNCKMFGFSTTNLDLNVIGSDKKTLTGDWVKVGLLAKSDNHFVGTAFNTNFFDLVSPNMTNPPRYLRIGNVSGSNATGVHISYSLSN